MALRRRKIHFYVYIIAALIIFSFSLVIFLLPSIKKLSVKVIVHTRQDDQETRDKWRAMYGNSQLMRQFHYKLLFPVGLALNRRERVEKLKELEVEHQWHGDILLGDYLDVYRNISLKQLSHLKYFTENCRKTTALLKIDDDVGWRIDKVASLVRNLHFSSRITQILCLVWRKMIIQRNPTNKWYVHPTTVNGSIYPNYCSGIAYLTTWEATRRIIKAAEEIDDVYITGMLAKEAGIPREDISSMYNLYYDNGTALELGGTVFQMGDGNNFAEMFKKSISGMRRYRKHPLTYYCNTPFCKL